MWVKNISKLPRPFHKGETIFVLRPGWAADVDIPADADLKKLGVEKLKIEHRDVVVGISVPIEKGGKKRKRRNAN